MRAAVAMRDMVVCAIMRCKHHSLTGHAPDSTKSRPPLHTVTGTWAITATVAGSGRIVNLYLFTILWPSTWMNKVIYLSKS